MAKSTFRHSKYWFRKLTTPAQDLLPSEYDAIAEHVETCSECARILDENRMLDQLIHALPAPDFPEGLSPRLQQLWQEEDRNRHKRHVHGGILGE